MEIRYNGFWIIIFILSKIIVKHFKKRRNVKKGLTWIMVIATIIAVASCSTPTPTPQPTADTTAVVDTVVVDSATIVTDTLVK